MIPFILRFAAVWIWNLVLFILWIALFGVFGNVRESTHGIPTNAGDGTGVQERRCTVPHG